MEKREEGSERHAGREVRSKERRIKEGKSK